jgi:hypothetical protein
MAVKLLSPGRAVVADHGDEAFSSNRYNEADTPPPPTAQVRPKLTANPQRMGSALELDLGGLLPDGDITVLEAGASVATFGNAAAFARNMPGMMSSPVTAEFIANGVTYQTPPLWSLMEHVVNSHRIDDDNVMRLVLPNTMNITTVPGAIGDWSDPAMWDLGRVPQAGDRVWVDSTSDITFDQEFADRLDVIRVDGVLRWATDQDTNMLVETIVVTPTGNLVMAEENNRLPSRYTAKITISNRAYRIDPNNPTDLDLANDPALISRGIIALGGWSAFGHHRKTHVKTKPGHLPMAGDTELRFDIEPVGWAKDDTLIVPGTAVDLDRDDGDGVNRRYDEERQIIAVEPDGDDWVIRWDAGQPLLYNHDKHNDNITTAPDGSDSAEVAAAKIAVEAQLNALQLPIAIKDRNIIVCSEAGTQKVQQRGHCMVMHMTSKSDLWDVAFISLGRTDKSKSHGDIVDGQFKYIEKGTRNIRTVPLTADANLKSRYPIHLHFCGFTKAVTDLVRDCFVEDAKAWAMVHHGCRANWLNNVMYRYQGAGMVSETGDELGNWDNNLALGLETSSGSYRYSKGAEEMEGKTGNFATQGYGFYYRGRAMVVTRNIAIGATWGHVFYHRSTQNGISDPIDTSRTNADINDLTWQLRSDSDVDSTDKIRRIDYPIIHFDKNEAIGCVGGVAVVKNAARQNHDLNIKISNFLGWGVWRGVILNYIGGYLVQDVVVICSNFDGQIRQVQPIENEGIGTGKSNQVAVDNIMAVGFESGVNFSGNAVQGIDNSQFSQDDPRFILGQNTFLGNAANVTYEDAGSVSTTTASVTRILSQPVDRDLYPTIDCPFIVAEFAGGNALQNIVQAVKTDNVSSAGLIPKPWDGGGLPTENNAGIRVREILSDVGYWVHDGTPVVLLPLYFSDRANANAIKQIHAISCTGDVSQYTNNGTFTRSAANPVCADITRNVTAGVDDTFDVLSGATGEPGTTLSLDLPWFCNNAVFTDLPPAHIKPNYCKAEVNRNGTITLTPTTNDYEGSDIMFVYVYDGQGRCCTVRITINIQAQ